MSMHAVGVVVGLTGLTMVVVSFGLVRQTAGPPTWDVRRWRPLWRQRDQFRTAGFPLFAGGLALLAVGVLMRLL